ncbi:EF-1 guanine nucleotide exchange domain protein [uncultured archaeon]|nr:EF-1 guanine nucleotide exchange domain protein [uncultured archaeon]
MPDKTILIMKIKPRDIGQIAKAMDAVRTIKSGKVMDVKKEPIGFGIEVIKAGITVDSKDEAAVERVTNEILALPEIEDAEVEGMTLL